MSEYINNAEHKSKRRLLKELILKLHKGENKEQVKNDVKLVLGSIPYEDVVLVEQELIAEGLPQEEVVRLCDLHTAILEGSIDRSSAKHAIPGHPAHTFKEENRALEREIAELEKVGKDISQADAPGRGPEIYYQVISIINRLRDVDKHYQRKENLLFPFLEKHGITAPPAVMWAKHDETRALMKKALNVLDSGMKNRTDIRLVIPELIEAARSITEMIAKEDNILFPMCLDTLTEDEWFDIYRQSPEIGFCLFDPTDEWAPANISIKDTLKTGPVMQENRIVLPSGSLSVNELTSLLNTIPVEVTFVDAEDTVRYFSQNKGRVFPRNRAIIGRKVQQCHPPASVATVQKILDDFRSGRQDGAAFWIDFRGRFVHIEYFALRDTAGSYLGTLEVTQDLTDKKKLEGERRLLNYS